MFMRLEMPSGSNMYDFFKEFRKFHPEYLNYSGHPIRFEAPNGKVYDFLLESHEFSKNAGLLGIP